MSRSSCKAAISSRLACSIGSNPGLLMVVDMMVCLLKIPVAGGALPAALFLSLRRLSPAAARPRPGRGSGTSGHGIPPPSVPAGW
ncbi:Uncharacterised protein [Bordetella pertussis]|nr:Uncharacterised protein [Bordetella pertussis]